MKSKTRTPKKLGNDTKKEDISLLKTIATLTAAGTMTATLLSGINELIKIGHTLGWW